MDSLLMSPDALPTDDPERLSAARPWQTRMWERIPGWARIGIISLTTIAAVHVLAGIRIWYGLQDPAEVIALHRNPTNIISYSVEPLDSSSDISDWYRSLAIGLRGRSGRDVQGINLGCEFEGQPFVGTGPTDEDLVFIARHFPNVEYIDLSNGTCTTQGLMTLKACRQLGQLFIHNMEIDDGLAQLLPHLPALYDLHVNYTNTGDEVVIAAAKHPHISMLDVQGTNVTQKGIDAWRAQKPTGMIQPTTEPTGVDTFLRWSDGMATWFFMVPTLIEIQGPYDADAATPWPRVSIRSEETFLAYVTEQALADYADGKYRMVVSLVLAKVQPTEDEPFELMECPPAGFEVTDGMATPSRLEIRAPIHRADAVRRMPPGDVDMVNRFIDVLVSRAGAPRIRRSPNGFRRL